MSENLRFILSHDDSPLARARSRLYEFLAPHMGDLEVNRILLAVEEAIVNTFEHGYGGGPGTIEVSAEKTDGEVRIELADTAIEYDPTSSPLPSPEQLTREGARGGYGIFLLRTLMKVQYRRREGGGNILILTPRGGHA
jgi:anti-sigma regulatory factor (Ser/Thr protein kinase)